MPTRHLIGWSIALPISILLAVLGLGLAIEGGPPRCESLYAAAECGDLADVRRHIRNGGDVNRAEAEGWTPLMLAAFQGNVRLMDCLLSHGARLDAQNHKGATPLLVAIYAGEWETVQWLVANGTNVQLPTAQGCTPLMLAVRKGDIRMIRLLLEQGADATACHHRNHTVWTELSRLETRTGFKRPDIRKCLVQHGAQEE